MIIARKTGKKRYFGIGDEARRLGVNASHLWLVLEGKRKSKSLLKRVRIKYQK